MTFAEALAALEARQETRVELGLDRFRGHLARLGDPHKSWPSIHVAGTNGKGSTCAILASILRATGRKTGLYTSPHLESPLERVQVDGQAMGEQEFAELISRAVTAEKGEPLTYFELLTSAAFQYFERRGVDIAVLETGLGGRLDATNVVDPLASVITSIGLDHIEHLGPGPAEIAREKAGIIKPGRPVVCAPLDEISRQVMERRAETLGSALVAARPWDAVSADWRSNRQTLRAPDGRNFTLGLLGLGQGRNAAAAHAALKAAGILVSQDSLARGLAQVCWPGRCEALSWGGKTLILDGAHNPQAMAHLKASLASSPWRPQDMLFILGALRDKDVDAMLAVWGPAIAQAVAAKPDSPRALGAAQMSLKIARAAPAAKIQVAKSVEEELLVWRSLGAPPAAVVCGSFYLVGSARRFLRGVEASAGGR